ncbi:MAG TPA: response regulator [Puia sp.]|nr:response regulator [Puia sp.]
MENAVFSKNYPLTILVAENGQDATSSAKSLLIQLGYQPEVATSSQEMLAMTRKKTYDVVMADVQIPDLDRILASQTGGSSRRPIFIGMTVSDSADTGGGCLRPGMDHSICKPVDPAELSLQLQACSVLSGTRRIRGEK